MAIHNLSEGVGEHFEFTVKGHSYLFRYLTIGETEKFNEFNGKESMDYLMQFISKKDPNAPEFSDMFKQMLIPEISNFMKMLGVEFGINASI